MNREVDLVQQHREWVAETRNLKHNARKYGALRRSEAARRRRRLTNRSLRTYSETLNHLPITAPRKLRNTKPVRAKYAMVMELTRGVSF